MQTHSLAGIRVLVTRPEHQAQALCYMLAEQGGQAVCFPVIEIKAFNVSNTAEDLIANLSAIDFAIFISPNAVEYGFARILAHGKIPDKLKLVTIGKASAQKLQQLTGRTADIYPAEHYNSEALLALESMQHDKVNNKRVLIFRGRGGRELLARTLAYRGAVVDYAEVYQRKEPVPDSTLLDAVWGSDVPDIVTVTSNEGLTNLLAMTTSKQYRQQLLQTPLVVVTEKMRLNAQTLGFKNDIIVAAEAGNEALLESVQDWAQQK